MGDNKDYVVDSGVGEDNEVVEVHNGGEVHNGEEDHNDAVEVDNDDTEVRHDEQAQHGLQARQLLPVYCGSSEARNGDRKELREVVALSVNKIILSLIIELSI